MRERPKAVTLSDTAAERVKALRAKTDKAFRRGGVKNGGCAGMEYVMEYGAPPDPLDERVEDQGVEIVVDSKSLLFLLGTQLDYEVTPLHAKFVFRNPNESDACDQAIHQPSLRIALGKNSLPDEHEGASSHSDNRERSEASAPRLLFPIKSNRKCQNISDG
jgi:iron-sulfur cluster assembly protein